MLRAGGPVERDDSKETSIADALLTTDPIVDGENSAENHNWNLEGRLRMQRNKGTSRPHILIKIIEDSKIPLGEEEAKLQSIKGKVERDLPIVEGGSNFPRYAG